MTPRAFEWRRGAGLAMGSGLPLTEEEKEEEKAEKAELAWPLAQGYRIGEGCEAGLVTPRASDWRRGAGLVIGPRATAWRSRSNAEALVWCASIQYTRFAVAASSYSLLGTSIESQTPRSISFYSWKRHLTLTEILDSLEHYWHEWWSYFEINSLSYSYDSTTNDDDVVQKKRSTLVHSLYS